MSTKRSFPSSSPFPRSSYPCSPLSTRTKLGHAAPSAWGRGAETCYRGAPPVCRDALSQKKSVQPHVSLKSRGILPPCLQAKKLPVLTGRLFSFPVTCHGTTRPGLEGHVVNGTGYSRQISAGLGVQKVRAVHKSVQQYTNQYCAVIYKLSKYHQLQ